MIYVALEKREHSLRVTVRAVGNQFFHVLPIVVRTDTAKQSTAQHRKGDWPKVRNERVHALSIRQYSSTVVDWVPISHIRFDIRLWRLIKYIININNCDVWDALNVYSGALVSCLN